MSTLQKLRKNALGVLCAVDASVVGGVLALCLLMRGEPWRLEHTEAALGGAILFVIVGQLNGLYSDWRGVPLGKQLSRLATSWAATVGALLLLAFLLKVTENFSRTQVLTWIAATPVALGLCRSAASYGLQEFRLRGFSTKAVAFAGSLPIAEQMARQIQESPWTGMRIAGFYDDRLVRALAHDAKNGATEDGGPQRVHHIPPEVGPVAGTFAQLIEDAKAGKIDIVYIALPLRADARIKRLVSELSDTTASVYVVPDLFLSSLMQARWTSLGEMPVLAVHETPFNGVAGWMKRLEDIVVGTIILTAIALPMLVLCILVKLSSAGPIFFRQRRYGLNGEEIWVLKFRTMYVMDDGAVVKQAQRNDPRITPLGAFMRRTSLDEFPQFLQVITGKMSIVGPRPHAVAHNELYRKQIHGYMLRHKVKPGITGWAQVNGWRGETDTLDKMSGRIEHDLNYIRNWSLVLDLKIIALTIFGRKTHQNAR